MLRQAVFLCLLLAGLAVAQVDKIQIFVLMGVGSQREMEVENWKWKMSTQVEIV